MIKSRLEREGNNTAAQRPLLSALIDATKLIFKIVDEVSQLGDSLSDVIKLRIRISRAESTVHLRNDAIFAAHSLATLFLSAAWFDLSHN
jgi:hypothetical protein